MLIGESPVELCERTVRALRDDELWWQLSRSGQRLIAERCSPEVVTSRLAELLQELADRAPRQAVAVR
jgi:hypothetical protein